MKNTSVVEQKITWEDFATVKNWKKQLKKHSKKKELSQSTWEAVGSIYTDEKAEEMLADTVLDTDQEYLNKYTTGRDSIWGTVTDEHRTDEEEMIL